VEEWCLARPISRPARPRKVGRWDREPSLLRGIGAAQCRETADAGDPTRRTA